MKKLIIIGAGGFGREVLSYCLGIQARSKDWEIAGFLDDNPRALEGFRYDWPILGTIQDYKPKDDEIFVMGIGFPTRQKMAIAKDLISKKAEFLTLIHYDAGMSLNVRLGKGCVMGPWSGVSCDAVVGDFVTINAYASVGHDSIIHDGCTISSYASIAGNVILGEGVFVGVHGCILPGVKVGEQSTIGAGSVVIKDVKPGTTVMGVPAKKIL
jgi:sugar O-acyltransferase (sialic acid O-acetyltransferase NeuD family)